MLRLTLLLFPLIISCAIPKDFPKNVVHIGGSIETWQDEDDKGDMRPQSTTQGDLQINIERRFWDTDRFYNAITATSGFGDGVYIKDALGVGNNWRIAYNYIPVSISYKLGIFIFEPGGGGLIGLGGGNYMIGASYDHYASIYLSAGWNAVRFSKGPYKEQTITFPKFGFGLNSSWKHFTANWIEFNYCINSQQHPDIDGEKFNNLNLSTWYGYCF
ncbi:hypothetical protein ACFLT7_03985 [candidate division KSB1 bacterium]